VNWTFDPHGRQRAAIRGIPGSLVEIVINYGKSERDGKIPGSAIKTGKVNGDRLEVLILDPSGDPLIVHSVWWL
jgi:hypothetical protein